MDTKRTTILGLATFGCKLNVLSRFTRKLWSLSSESSRVDVFWRSLSSYTGSKDFKFREMPSLGLPEVEKDQFIDNCASYFLGDPNKLLNAKEGEGEEATEEVPKEEEEGEEGE
jgi:hypothetical protein